MAELDAGIAVVEGENPPAEVVDQETPVSGGIDVDALWGEGLERLVQSKIQQETRHLTEAVKETERKYQMALDYMAQEFNDDYAGDRALMKRLIAQGLDQEEAEKVRADVKTQREIAALKAERTRVPAKATETFDAPAATEADPRFQASLEHVWRSLTAYGKELGVDYQALYEMGKFGTKTPAPTKDDPFGLHAYEDKARQLMRAHKADIEKRANPKPPAPSATAGRGGSGDALPTWEEAKKLAARGELDPAVYQRMLANTP